ncbi:GNAT acetyltransferase 2-domain-containing protein [Zopfochytrium polystomum]|nr:GNAT acetyltransferase 2-domain-containing protein [Zopfochytrium polystomum]
MINNGVLTNHRSFFVMVGDRGKDQVVTLHYLLAKARVTARPNVLWCYKKELGFSSHRKKRMKQIQKEIARGQREADEDDPFELFISSTSIRYTFYKETENILGQTFGMCILQDFEALTPNLLARTIETVEGGGLVVILLKTMTSLKQLYAMTMDVHARYRTEAHHDTVARFNERFILSLGSCETCLVVDDELNILPLSAGKHVKPKPKKEDDNLTPAQKELAELKESLADTQPVSALLSVAKTLDQGRAVLTFIEAIAEKSLRSTVSLTAARGRGKSAALGISIAAAIAYGYSNIFITSPSPENLKTLFEFVFKTFDALGYEEHLDYDIIQSTNPDFHKAVVRVNVFRQHRQTIQYIQPTDAAVLAQAELVVIDEAAAIPLTLVKSLLGPYLVFMASTINGYEGTGRSLSLKLIAQLRQQSAASGGNSVPTASGSQGVLVGRDGKERKGGSGASGSATTDAAGSSTTAALPRSMRVLREIKLEEPIRYGAGDPVEAWLTRLLCLDACEPAASTSSLSRGLSGQGGAAGCPHPDDCELYYVNRDTLFSFHPVSEAFLQRMMSLYVASHYKNSPNDLQLMSDAPAHHLFVLLPPPKKATGANAPTTLPDPLVVIQVCLEGSIARNSALSSLARGVRASGDLIPWVLTQQFQDDAFASLSGARVVRIATHPDFTGMGYGQRAIKLLEQYYVAGRTSNQAGGMGLIKEDGVDTPEEEFQVRRVTDEELSSASLETDVIKVRDAGSMPPLLLKLTERPSREKLDWLGVSFGLTQQLNKFWKRAGYFPVYLRQTPNELTGEHSSIMLRPLRTKDEAEGEDNAEETIDGRWVSAFSWDFRRRFVELLGYQLRKFEPVVVLSILESCQDGRPESLGYVNTQSELRRHFTPFDLKRLDSYTNNLLDYHVIIDMIPTIARLYYLGYLSSPVLEKIPEGGATTAHAAAVAETGTKGVHLSPVQSAILLAAGLQRKTLEEVAAELTLPVSQVMALFAKVVRKFSLYFTAVEEAGITAAVDAENAQVETEAAERRKAMRGKLVGGKDDGDEDEEGKRDVMDEEAWDPMQVGLDQDLLEEGDAAMEALRKKQREMISVLNLEQYAIKANDEDWNQADAAAAAGGKRKAAGIIQVKSLHSTKKRRMEQAAGKAERLSNSVKGARSGIFNPQAAAGKTIKGKKGERR